MPGHKKDKKHEEKLNKDSKEKCSIQYEKDGITINITINNTFNIGNKEIQIEQRAEGGGQINKEVGVNSNQGGQNAIGHSKTKNYQSQFADGNGRSGIAGDHNDEAGGQQGIKVTDSKVKNSKIKSASDQFQINGGQPGEESDDTEIVEDNE